MDLDEKYIYHITHAKNLPLILEKKALFSKQRINQISQTPINIAYEASQETRSVMPVRIGPGGVIHDYVPFYFANRTPMLGAIHKRRVEGFQGTQRDIIYLVSKPSVINSHGLKFVFTDGHANKKFTSFFNQLNDLNRVDWEVIDSWKWKDTEEDNDRMRRKMAEFLVYDQVPFECIIGIACFDSQVKEYVIKICEKYGWQDTDVKIMRKWYFDD